jgi:serine/threonine-protein kinase HipA
MKLTVRYRGEPELPVVGVLADDARGRIFFEYDADWRAKGIELSPVMLPLTTVGAVRTGSPGFGPLFGLFDDSLPDWWGQQVMRRYFDEMNLPWSEVGPLEKLACQGAFGIGALTYEPDLAPRTFRETMTTEVVKLVESAKHLYRGESGEIIPALIRAGMSPGGAQPKALVAFRDDFSDVLAGGSEIPEGYSRWLIKFQMDREDSQCREEHAIAMMATVAGIEVPETRLLETADGAAHFLSRRFDHDGRSALHLHSYGGLTHSSVRELIDYADLMDLTRDLTRRDGEIEEMFRRAVFNIAIANEDDHSRNHAFLMDARGDWRLSPAYDMTRTGYALRTGFRAAGVLGKFTKLDITDLRALAKMQGLRRAEDVIETVMSAVRKWPDFAEQAGLSETQARILYDEFPAMRWG